MQSFQLSGPARDFGRQMPSFLFFSFKIKLSFDENCYLDFDQVNHALFRLLLIQSAGGVLFLDTPFFHSPCVYAPLLHVINICLVSLCVYMFCSICRSCSLYVLFFVFVFLLFPLTPNPATVDDCASLILALPEVSPCSWLQGPDPAKKKSLK